MTTKPAHTGLDIVVRLVVFTSFDAGYSWLIRVASSPTADPIGIGVLEFMLLAGIATTWSVFDGLHRSPARLVVTWLVAGALSGVTMTALDQITWGHFEWSALGNDLASTAPFLAALIIIPALFFGGTIAAVTRSGLPSTPEPSRH